MPDMTSVASSADQSQIESLYDRYQQLSNLASTSKLKTQDTPIDIFENGIREISIVLKKHGQIVSKDLDIFEY